MGKIATFSFDDGGAMDFQVMELFARHGVTCTFYVPSALLSLAYPVYNMPIAAVRAHYKNWEVGSHTVSHRKLPELDRLTTDYEVSHSKAVIEQELERPVTLFAHPYGFSGPYTEPALQRAGYAWARRIMRTDTQPPHERHRYHMPIDCMFFLDDDWVRLTRHVTDDRGVHVLAHSHCIEADGGWAKLERWLCTLIDAGYTVMPNTQYFETMMPELNTTKPRRYG